MTPSGTGSEGSDDASATDGSFARTLQGFKRDGCLLLVTGDIPEPVSARASRKLLGTPTEYRHRILAVTDPLVEEPATHLPGSLSAGSEGVTLIDERDSIQRDSGVDDVADAILDELPNEEPSGGAPLSGVPSSGVPSGGAASDGGSVRFTIATLTPFQTDDELRDAVPSLLDTLQEAAHARDAIGAIHLPIPDDHPDVDLLIPHVDARIEVRDTDTALPEQRWYLPEDDATTKWVTM